MDPSDGFICGGFKSSFTAANRGTDGGSEGEDDCSGELSPGGISGAGGGGGNGGGGGGGPAFMLYMACCC